MLLICLLTPNANANPSPIVVDSFFDNTESEEVQLMDDPPTVFGYDPDSDVLPPTPSLDTGSDSSDSKKKSWRGFGASVTGAFSENICIRRFSFWLKPVNMSDTRRMSVHASVYDIDSKTVVQTGPSITLPKHNNNDYYFPVTFALEPCFSLNSDKTVILSVVADPTPDGKKGPSFAFQAVDGSAKGTRSLYMFYESETNPQAYADSADPAITISLDMDKSASFGFKDKIAPFIENTCYPVYYKNTVAGKNYAVDAIFPPDASAQCLYFANDGCNEESTTSFDAQSDSHTMYVSCTQTYWAQLTIIDTEVNNRFPSNNFVVKGLSGGGLCGDPHFWGFDGRSFMFNGVAKQVYNVFSNEHVNLNSLFVSAHAAGKSRKNSTVNGAVGIRTHELNITMYAEDYQQEQHSISFTLNGDKRTIKEGETIHHKCATMTLERNKNTAHHHHTFSVVTSKYEVYVYVSEAHTKYINGRYFDYFVSAALNERLGGVLGATSKKYDPAELVAQESKFRASDLLCSGGSSSYVGLPVCSNASLSKSKRTNDGGCENLPNGHACTKDAQCAEGHCSSEGVCAPSSVCFADSTCGEKEYCDLGTCWPRPF